LDEKKVITATLRYGVLIASILVISGLTLFIVINPNANVYKFNTSNISLTDFKNPLTITLYGVIVLVSIPPIIVLEQIIIYASEKDKIYIGISALVFTLMLFAILIMPRLLHI